MRSKFKVTLVTAIFLISFLVARAQNNSVSIGTTSTNASAVLWLNGNGSQGLIIPVGSRASVATPAKGMLIFDTNQLYVHDGSAWNTVSGSGGGGTYSLSYDATTKIITLNPNSSGTATINLTTTALSGGDLGGTLGTPTVTGIQSKALPSLPNTLQYLAYDGATGAWKFQSPAGSGDMLKATYDTNNDGTVDKAATITGTLPLANGGTGITTVPGANQVLTTNGGSTVGWTNISALPSGPVLSATQVLTGNGTSNSATVLTGDASINAGSLTVNGLKAKALPTLPATLQYLAYDGTTSTWKFQSPAGSGDMLKATYDTNNDGTVDASASLTTTLPLTKGGTGITTTPTANQLLATNGSSTVGWTNVSGDASLNAGAFTVSGLQSKVLPSLPATLQYLAYDGTTSTWKFQSPAGSGDMLKATYDTNNDGTVDASASLTTTLPLAKGGTGITTTPTANQLLATNGSSTVGWTNVSGDASLNAGAFTVSGLQSKVLPSLPATLQYLAYDGTTSTWKFQSPAGSGDMLKATYDTNNDGTVDASASLTTTLPLAKGGTGITTTPTANQLLASNGSSTVGWTNVSGDASLNAGVFTVSGLQSKVLPSLPATLQYLAYDGTTSSWKFQSPAGSGDMLKATYDTNNDGTVDASASLTTTLPLAKGGTGITTVPTASQVLTTDNTGNVTWINQSSLSPTFSSQLANTFLAAPNGSAGVPTFRTIVAADVPNIDASKITTGTLPIARGGTNSTAVPTNGGVGYGTGTAHAYTAVGTAGQFLQSNGSAAPTWVNLPGPTGSAGGDLTGTYPNPTIAKLGGQSYTFPASNSTAGVLTNSGTGILTWVPTSGFLTTTLNSGNIIVGNSSNVATAMVMNGDATIDNTAKVTIGSGVITATKLANGSVNGGVGGVITDGSIVDADINSSGITTAGKVSGNAITSGTIGGSTNVNTTGDLTTTGTGSLSIGGTTTFGGIKYTWPTSALTGSTFLSTDAAGNLSWASIPSGWTLSGNSGTSSATNFIGTIDNVALRFKTNSANSGLIDPLNSNSFWGYLAGNSTTGAQNVAVGTNALMNNSSGGGNVAVGVGALQSNTTGSNNLAIGNFADVASGSLTNASAIGPNAQVATSNSLVLGGTGSNAVNVGIGTTTPAAALDVNTSSTSLLNLNGGANPLIRLSESGTYKAYLQIYSGDFYLGTITAGTNIVLHNNGTNALTVTPSGNIGINTTPAAGNQMDVLSTNGAGNALNATNNAGGNAIYAYAPSGGYGVWGYAPNSVAVYGQSGSSYGLYGYSDSGYGIVAGTNTGTAGYFSGNTVVTGYTQLGAGSPQIQMAYYTLTTASSQGGTTSISTGIAHNRIIGIQVMVEYSAGSSSVMPNYVNNTGYQFNWYESGGTIFVWLTSGNSANILSKVAKILVTYTP